MSISRSDLSNADVFRNAFLFWQPAMPGGALGLTGIRAGRVEGQERYRLRRASAECLDEPVSAQWSALLERSRSPERIYQSPEFFRFLSATADATSRFEVFAAVRESDGAVMGILPLRIQSRKFGFGLGPLELFSTTMDVINILGSVPLAAIGERGRIALLEQLFAFFPECAAASMQAVPVGGDLWHRVERVTGPASPFRKYVLDGVRECHTIPLPSTFAQYVQKFGAKKRYNLSRQVRLLEQQLGALELTRVDRPEQVPALMQALVQLGEPSGADPRRAALYEASAANGLLMHYVLRCGGEPVAIALGSCFAKVWHVHRIICAPAAMALSGGTSLVHLALEDAIDRCGFVLADFGYGTPNQSFKSTHVLERRAHVMLYPKRAGRRYLLQAHALNNRLSLYAVDRVKRARARLHAMLKPA